LPDIFCPRAPEFPAFHANFMVKVRIVRTRLIGEKPFTGFLHFPGSTGNFHRRVLETSAFH
jgi:hypothetical protein